MFSRLDTLIVRVRDLRAAREWYDNALGVAATYVEEAEGLAVLGLKGTSLTLWQLKSDDGAGASGAGTSLSSLSPMRPRPGRTCRRAGSRRRRSRRGRGYGTSASMTWTGIGWRPARS